MPNEKIICPACSQNRPGQVGKRIIQAVPKPCIVCDGTGIASRAAFVRYRFLFGHGVGTWVMPDNEWPDAD